MTGIPFDEDEVINKVIVTRRSGRVHTASRPVCVPLPPASQTIDTTPSVSEHDADVYSDTEGMELLPETRSRSRKGQSHSVSVSLMFTRTDMSDSIVDDSSDKY